jgi:DNA-binding MarR family transcriptional regulator
MAHRPTSAELDVWRRWLRAQRRLVDRLDRELRSATGLTLEQYDVLVQLANAPGARAHMSELADAVVLARSSCTRLIDRLEADGLVAREPDASDGRAVWAILTPRGRGRLRRAAAVHLAGVRAGFTAHLHGDDTRRLGAFLDRVLAGDRHEDRQP